MSDTNANAVCCRKVGNTSKTSTFAQILWAIDVLGVKNFFKARVAPLSIEYIPTGQLILFRGLDKAQKQKSIKLRKGYFKYAWFEELDEFDGMEEIRKVTQSLMRGGSSFCYFYSFNPPKSINSWVNTEVLVPNNRRLVHHSTYLTVPREWLGEEFFLEAEHIKKVNEMIYKHEYLGEATGTGGNIFTNVISEEITDAQIKIFDRIKQGIDWGYAVDPFAFGKMHYDKTRKRLYIYDEIYKVGLLNDAAIKEVNKKRETEIVITADSAEPKSIDEFKSKGVFIRGAEKGKDSVRYGIKFLQRLESIVIDPTRCPNALKEFVNYELIKNKDGTWKDEYPDKNNHFIDLTRYALEDDMNNKVSVLDVL